MGQKHPKIIRILDDANSHKQSKRSLGVYQFPCSAGKQDVLMSFFADTGAEISICKAQSLREDVYVFKHDSVELSGFLSNVKNISTLGTCSMQILVNNRIIDHDFHIINGEDINLLEDAVLGMDFLGKCNLKLVFENSGNDLFGAE